MINTTSFQYHKVNLDFLPKNHKKSIISSLQHLKIKMSRRRFKAFTRNLIISLN